VVVSVWPSTPKPPFKGFVCDNNFHRKHFGTDDRPKERCETPPPLPKNLKRSLLRALDILTRFVHGQGSKDISSIVVAHFSQISNISPVVFNGLHCLPRHMDCSCSSEPYTNERVSTRAHVHLFGCRNALPQRIVHTLQSWFDLEVVHTTHPDCFSDEQRLRRCFEGARFGQCLFLNFPLNLMNLFPIAMPVACSELLFSVIGKFHR
jgi:hypothetical protein